MTTVNIELAIKQKFAALTASNFPSSTVPPLYFGSAGQVVNGLQIRPPYVVLIEESRTVIPIDFERNNLVVAGVTFEVYYADQGHVEQAANAVRWNGGTVGQGSGFDYGALTDLQAPRSSHQIVPVGEPRSLAEQLDKDGNRIHGVALTYRITVLESA